MIPSDSYFYDEFRRRAPKRAIYILCATVLIAVFFAYGLLMWRAPRYFPENSHFVINNGASFKSVATSLYEKKIIRSTLWFRFFGAIFGGVTSVKAGDYYFSEKISLPSVAWRITHGAYELKPISITIPEGLNNREIARKIKKTFLDFDSEEFLVIAKEKEGFLFPDTYKFYFDLKAKDVIREMSLNFEKKIEPLNEEMIKSGRTFSDIIIMASILEKEARTPETRKIISGILWKRFDSKMPLQVDAVFPYIFAGKSFDLTDGDLFVESPYNTYKYIGLPPTPISNPGLEAIKAALAPVNTPYWYYLSDKDGEMHYAKTHDEHLINRAKYLNK